MTQFLQTGVGSAGVLHRYLDARNVRRAFVVTGRKSFHLSGAADFIKNETRGKATAYFDGVSEIPTSSDVVRGIAAFNAFKGEVIVAIGGGSVIDVAKSVAAFANHSSDPLTCIVGDLPLQSESIAPIIAIPTTAGSGSEATHFAVVYVEGRKYSVAHPALLPEAALVDPMFSATMPPRLTAITGVDALSQAIESYWSNNSTPESQRLSAAAINLLWSSIRTAVREPTIPVRERMAHGANLAGQAINITKTTAPHAFSYHLTTHFGMPHGEAVGITLPAFFLYNASVTAADVSHPRGCHHVKTTMLELSRLLGCESPADAAQRLRELLDELGLRTSLEKVGVSSAEARSRLATSADTARLRNNPRSGSTQDLRQLIESI